MTDVPNSAHAPPTTAPAPTEGLFCPRCGYDLDGLALDARCPECGTPVETALRGGLLEYSSPEYLAALHQGVFLVLAAIIGQILVMTVNFLSALLIGAGGGNRMAFLELVHFVSLGLSLLLLYGWWRLSTPDPAMVEGNRGDLPRRVVRALLIAAVFLNFAGVFVSNARNPYLLITLGVLGLVIFAGRFFAEMLYIRWLAPRIPNERVHRRASTLLWLGPLLYTVGLVLLGLGPLIALVLYWNMLDWVRKDLKAIRARVAYGAAR
jgi:hypothetical protein